jgi:acetate kinase
MSDASRCVLVINGGSSSLKFAVYVVGPKEALLLSGAAERIGLRGGRFLARDAAGATLVEEHGDLPDHDAALKKLLDWLHQRADGRPEMIGHRVVHGGPHYNEPQLITGELLEKLQDLVRLAPEHLPPELKCIRAVQHYYPDLKQVACFDTAFHRHMPEVAQRLPLARSLWHEGVRRYGFHGLSYEYIVGKLQAEAPAEASGRLIVAHLGNGASMAAIRDGKGVETTMGLTPTGGLMMGTRSGDLDPGVLLYLLEEKGRSPAAIDYLVNERSGLVGVSDISSDMRDLLDQEAREPHAAQAVAMYCYHAKKWLGALAAVLGGVDSLVFTAGVGANSPAVRGRICEGMDYLGLKLDAARNESNAPIISRDDSRVTVRAIKTNEELVIARHTAKLLDKEQKPGKN